MRSLSEIESMTILVTMNTARLGLQIARTECASVTLSDDSCRLPASRYLQYKERWRDPEAVDRTTDGLKRCISNKPGPRGILDYLFDCRSGTSGSKPLRSSGESGANSIS